MKQIFKIKFSYMLIISLLAITFVGCSIKQQEHAIENESKQSQVTINHDNALYEVTESGIIRSAKDEDINGDNITDHIEYTIETKKMGAPFHGELRVNESVIDYI